MHSALTRTAHATRKLAAILAAAALGGCAMLSQQPAGEFALQRGDLLFQDLDAGPLCDAIETVTEGVDGADFSHVGMVSRIDHGQVWIIEALSDGVVETPLADFLDRSHDDDGNPKVLVGRIQPPYDEHIDEAIAAAVQYIGYPYDDVYALDNTAFYCSELIHEAYRQALDGETIFETPPMTYNDPATGQVFPAWQAYFDELNAPIPQDDPGLNPGGMSRSPALKIVHAYGRPANWNGQL